MDLVVSPCRGTCLVLYRNKRIPTNIIFANARLDKYHKVSVTCEDASFGVSKVTL